MVAEHAFSEREGEEHHVRAVDGLHDHAALGVAGHDPRHDNHERAHNHEHGRDGGADVEPVHLDIVFHAIDAAEHHEGEHELEDERVELAPKRVVRPTQARGDASRAHVDEEGDDGVQRDEDAIHGAPSGE